MAAHLLCGIVSRDCVNEINLKLNGFVSFVCNLHDNNYNDAR